MPRCHSCRLLLRALVGVGFPLLCGAMLLGRAAAAGLATDEENARYLLDKGEVLLLKGDPEVAVDKFEVAARKYKGTLSGAAAQMRIIEIEEGRHRWVAAFDACQDFFEWFPGSTHFERVLESQIRIALRVQKELSPGRSAVRRDKDKESKGAPDLPGRGEVSKMFRLVLKNGAHTELEPRIRYDLGVALEREELPKSARAAFLELVEFYPEHYLADDAAFQVAYIDFKKVMKGEQGRLFAAQLAFEDFLQRHEGSEKVAEARYCLGELGKREAASLLATARYYEGQDKPEAALKYYDKLFSDCAGSAEATEALRSHVAGIRESLPEGEILRAEPSTGSAERDPIWLVPMSLGPLEAVEASLQRED